MAELMGAAGGDISGLSPDCLTCGMANQDNPMFCTQPTAGLTIYVSPLVRGCTNFLLVSTEAEPTRPAPTTPAPETAAPTAAAPAAGAAPCTMTELMGAAGGDISGLSPDCLTCGLANQADPMFCTQPAGFDVSAQKSKE